MGQFHGLQVLNRLPLPVLIVLGLALGGLVSLIPSPQAQAARNTTYICDRYVVSSGSVTRPEGTYYTYEYGLVGNDSARYQNGETGSRINGPDADCQNWDDGVTCLSAVGQDRNLMWGCNGEVNYDNAWYRSQFGGRSATRVFLGTPIRTPADKENYNPAVLDGDPSRAAPGITAQKIHPFGSINDASIAIINGDPLFCVGLSFLHPGCRFDVRNDGVNGTPGAWAGYLNGAYPGDADRAIQNINATYRGSVWQDDSSVPLQNLASGGSFRLQLEGVNTQDPWFSCTPVWSNGNAPSSSNSNCYNPPNFPNSKAGVFITYFVPVGTPTNQPPQGTVNGTCAPNPRVSGRITDADNSSPIFYEVYRDALPGWGGTKIGEGYTSGSGDYSVNVPQNVAATDRNYYVVAQNVISAGNNQSVLIGSVRFSCTINCEANVLTNSPGIDSPAPNESFRIEVSYTSSTSISAGAIFSASPALGGITNGAAVAFSPSPSTSGTMTRTLPGAPAGEYTVTILVGNAGVGLIDTCTITVKVANKPYFRVWTNDIKAGGGFLNTSGQCIKDGNGMATIIGYGGSQGTTPPNSDRFSGASSEYAVFALGEVRNFFSAAMRSPRTFDTGRWPTPPHGLTFANARIEGLTSNGPTTSDPADGYKVANYGGASQIDYCTQDWFNPDTLSDNRETLPVNYFFTTAAGTGAEATIVPANSTASQFQINNTGGNINRPRAIMVLKDMPVVITGNIIANNNQTLYIIAEGDIRIAKNVTQIDAVLISKKRIITCVESDTGSVGNLFTANQLYSECGGQSSAQKLTIRGALVAREVKLLRTYGTRESATENQPYVTSGGVFNAAAEEIIFDPTLYTGNSAIKGLRQPSQIDFMTSLPPIL
ncbi:hypothetical protein E6P97_01775 [Patescibacteria group bacterium]|nr:MAG: hypothetical protein E6P97_01775 [Patescibacteria group bacterium]